MHWVDIFMILVILGGFIIIWLLVYFISLVSRIYQDYIILNAVECVKGRIHRKDYITPVIIYYCYEKDVTNFKRLWDNTYYRDYELDITLIDYNMVIKYKPSIKNDRVDIKSYTMKK